MAAANVISSDSRRQGSSGVAMVDRALPDPATPEVAGLEQGPLENYPGGKNGMGIYQRLINLIPPHDVFIECFFGSGAITRRIRRASTNIGIDVDAGVIARHGVDPAMAGVKLMNGDAMEWLDIHRWRLGERVFIYADPPYLGRTRSRSDRALYRHEMLTAEEHEQLLQILTTIPAMVMISGYRCRLYNRWLKSGPEGRWTRIDYQAMTRGGLKDEAVWFNYPAPTELHDYRYLGEDFRERHRIARKIQRWVGKLGRMPVLERAAVIAGCNAAGGGGRNGGVGDAATRGEERQS